MSILDLSLLFVNYFYFLVYIPFSISLADGSRQVCFSPVILKLQSVSVPVCIRSPAIQKNLPNFPAHCPESSLKLCMVWGRCIPAVYHSASASESVYFQAEFGAIVS